MSELFLYSSHSRRNGTRARWLLQEDIDGCADGQILTTWYLDLEESVDVLKAQIQARSATETDDDEWAEHVSKMLASAGIGMAKVKRRCKDMGIDPTGRIGGLGRLLHQREQEVAAYKVRLAKYEDVTTTANLGAK